MSLTSLVFQGTEIFKAVLTFDNNATYTARSDTTGATGSIISLNVDEISAITSGNPIGVLSPNSASLSIHDGTDNLLPTNTSSPYYGYMRKGVHVQLTISLDGGTTWNPFGDYYTDDWSVTYEQGVQAAQLTCTDKLSYIGNSPIPSIPKSTNVDLSTLLDTILSNVTFNGAKLIKNTDYTIDPNLTGKVSAIVGLTNGSVLRDVLNTICQALLARITINRSGVIQIQPAFPSFVAVGTLNQTVMNSLTFSQNQDLVYNKVQLTYTQVNTNQPPEQIVQQDNVKLSPGTNSYNNISLDQSILEITDVYFDLNDTPSLYADMISDITYSASQSGISITIKSTEAGTVYGSLVVEGVIAGTTIATSTASVSGTDAKVSNTLSISSDLIQDVTTANTYVSDVVTYIQDIQKQVILSGALTPLLTINDYITISIGNTEVDGNYLVLEYNLNTALGTGSYNTTLTLAKTA